MRCRRNVRTAETASTGGVITRTHPTHRAQAGQYTSIGHSHPIPQLSSRATIGIASGNGNCLGSLTGWPTALMSAAYVTTGVWAARPDVYGRAILKGPHGPSAVVRSVWFLAKGTRVPRFVTAYPGDSIGVELVAAWGRTEALLMLHPDDVRIVGEDDLVAVRPVGSAAPRSDA
jgi:hypothetical protein